MKTALAIAVPLGAFLTLVAWRLSELLSPDAIDTLRAALSYLESEAQR